MKQCNNILISVFAKPQDDFEKLKQTLLNLVPFDLEKEKLQLKIIDAEGFDEKKIKILQIYLDKDKHTNAFSKFFFSKLDSSQKEILRVQIESRLDAEFYFFIRLDKTELMNEKFVLTDSGNCFHIKFSIACFPKNKDAARKVVGGFLS